MTETGTGWPAAPSPVAGRAACAHPLTARIEHAGVTICGVCSGQLGEPAPVFCSATPAYRIWPVCSREAGHHGWHASADFEWPEGGLPGMRRAQ